MNDCLADAIRKLQFAMKAHDTRSIHRLVQSAIIDLKLATMQHAYGLLPVRVSLPDRGITIQFPIHQSQSRKAN